MPQRRGIGNYSSLLLDMQQCYVLLLSSSLTFGNLKSVSVCGVLSLSFPWGWGWGEDPVARMQDPPPDTDVTEGESSADVSMCCSLS